MYLVIIILILIYIREAVTPITEPAWLATSGARSQIDNIRASLSLSYTHTHSYI